MSANGFCMFSAGLEVQNFQLAHGANSFIQYFMFCVNRQRRIGGAIYNEPQPKKNR